MLYNARDMAVLRASMLGAQVVLASATPSLESWVNAKAGKYQRLDLTRALAWRRCRICAPLTCGPKRCRRAAGFRPPWRRGADAAGAGEQSLLFLNRRGYAPLTRLPRLRPPDRL